jgi:CRP/FNR family transcriptional regulator, cyclic AMP receptor protein
MDREAAHQVLQRIPWFLELNPHQMDSLVQISNLQQIADGEILFHEGDSENCLYVLIEGRIQIQALVPGHGMVGLYYADPLDIVGWDVMTPVVRQRTGTAIACGICRLICFDSQLFRHMCETDRDFGYIIMRRVANVVASRLLSTRLKLFDLLQPVNK